MSSGAVGSLGKVTDAMVDRTFSTKRCLWGVLTLAALGCMVFCSAPLPLSAQEPAAVDAIQQPTDGAETESPVPPEPIAPVEESQAKPQPIGGGSEPSPTYYYRSPLKQFGSDLFVGSYAINLFVSLAYLAVVYPLQSLFGSNKVEPVTLWMLLPIAGPWFAQYEDSVKSKPFWRVVLIGDAAIQAGGLVIALLGLALSGTRTAKPEAKSSVELSLGTQGAGLTGFTLSIHAL